MISLAQAALLSTPPVSDREPSNGDLLHPQKMAALGELASGITHDFRNILQTVMSCLDMIQSRSNDPEEVQRLANSALRASERGISLTKRLLKFSRREAADARPVDPLSSLESASETLARTIKAMISVRVEPPPSDLWNVVIDPTEFELALINLGINARDAMRDGGRIQFGARNIRIPLVDRRALQRPLKPDKIDRRGPQLTPPAGDYVAIRPRADTRVTRGHFDQRQSKMAVAEHVAAILRFATDLCDTENGGIPWGLVLSRNS
jgi:nitrogen-specific signal transduction histidine kinase